MDGWMDGWRDEWMDGWMEGWRDGWRDEWMDGWMDGCQKSISSPPEKAEVARKVRADLQSGVWALPQGS